MYRHNLDLPPPPKPLPPKNKNPLLPKNYRRTALPANNYRHILVLPPPLKSLPPKKKNRLPPKNYRRMALPPRLCPPKKALPTITLKKTEDKIIRKKLISKIWSRGTKASPGRTDVKAQICHPRKMQACPGDILFAALTTCVVQQLSRPRYRL